MEEPNNNQRDRQPDEFDPSTNQQQPYSYDQPSNFEHQLPPNAIRMTYAEARSLKTIQRQALASGVCGLVSMFVGGVALSTAGLIVAILGMRKLKTFGTQDSRITEFLGKLKRLLVSSLVVCVVGLGLNAYAAFTMFPEVMHAVQTSDYSQLFGGEGTAGQSGDSDNSSSSTWG